MKQYFDQIIKEFQEFSNHLPTRTLDLYNSDFYIYLQIKPNTYNEMQTAFHDKVNKNTKPSSDYLVSADCFTIKNIIAYEK